MVELTYCISLKKNTQGVIYLKKACDYIDKHFLEEISIPEIAAYVDINKSYLQALFTDKIGCTINHYITRKDWSRQYFCFAIVVLELRILHLLPDITADSIFLILLKNFMDLHRLHIGDFMHEI